MRLGAGISEPEGGRDLSAGRAGACTADVNIAAGSNAGGPDRGCSVRPVAGLRWLTGRAASAQETFGGDSGQDAEEGGFHGSGPTSETKSTIFRATASRACHCRRPDRPMCSCSIFTRCSATARAERVSTATS